MERDVQLHALHKISNTTVYSYPFKYIYINQIFPDYFYDEMMANLPGNEYYSKTMDAERIALSFVQHDLDRLPETQKMFWSSFAKWINSEEFAITMAKKMGLPEIIDGETAIYEPSCSLTRSWQGYDLPPHTDIATKMLSMLIYMVKDESHKDLGTAIFLPKERDFECDGTSARHPYHYFEHLKTLEFKPNTLSAFCRSRQSFHGVFKNEDPDFIRDTVGYVLKHTNYKNKNQQ